MHEALPGWLGALREDSGLAGDLGIQWLDEEARQRLYLGALSVLRTPGGDENWNRRGLERLERCVPLALGPERSKRLSRAESSTALFFDPARPGEVSLSLAASMSPMAWAAAPATSEGIRALFGRYFAEAGPVSRLSGKVRSLVNFGDADRERIEAAVAEGHPMIDDASWYSACDDDPWLGHEDLRPILLTSILRDAKRERRDRIPSVAFRTLFTRSMIKIEKHGFGLWVVEVRYAPAPDAAAVRWVNEVFSARFPEDVPVDVVGSNVMQGGHTFASDLDEEEARGEIEDFTMAARLALAPGEPDTTVRLRAFVERFADRPEKLLLLTNLADAYRDRGAVFEIAARAAGTDLAEMIFTQLGPVEASGEGEGDDDDEGEGDDDGDDDGDDEEYEEDE
jgi:hypothetical protein